LIALGIALHSWADTFAHEGFTAEILDSRNARRGFGWEPEDKWYARIVGELGRTGHSAAGHTTDWPFANVGKALEAAKSIYYELASFARAHGYAKQAIRPWPSIENRIEGLLAYEAIPEAARVLNWKRAIRDDFERVHYYESDPTIPEAWKERFRTAVEEQRHFILDPIFHAP
jgi:hypothetical protein